LAGVAKVPAIPAEGSRSAWAQYAIEVKNRDGLKAHLQSRGIPSVIYYVKPLHSQVAYRDFPANAGSVLPVSESLPERILCLPMHPYLDVRPTRIWSSRRSGSSSARTLEAA
jgi:dTDP-4-amino-4,6-dideoxygalactose transaminase